jgi:hypothetical protein
VLPLADTSRSSRGGSVRSEIKSRARLARIQISISARLTDSPVLYSVHTTAGTSQPHGSLLLG